MMGRKDAYYGATNQVPSAQFSEKKSILKGGRGRERDDEGKKCSQNITHNLMA